MGTIGPPGKSRPRARRWLLGIGVIAAGATLMAILVGWMAYRHIPSWYQPAYVPYEDEQDARDELGAAFTALSQGMAQGQSFDFDVRQDELNRWLVARDRIWPASKRWIPEHIQDPMIVFQHDEVVLAGTWTGPGPRTVVNLRLRIELVGGKLRVRLVSVRGGSLPLPLGLIKREAVRLEREHTRPNRPLLPEGASMSDAFDGAPVPRDIPWSQPRGKFRIETLTLIPGELQVRLRPIDRRVARKRGALSP